LGQRTQVLIGTDSIAAAKMVLIYNEQKRAFNTHINCDEAGKNLMNFIYTGAINHDITKVMGQQ
jgi:hypothetical protein